MTRANDDTVARAAPAARDATEDTGEQATMKAEDFKDGKLWIGFKSLNDNDFKRILQKLSSVRERRHRKCQRYDGVNAILSLLPPPKPVHYLNFVGNSKIGDSGMEHIQLVPDSVTDFDLSDCGLTAQGARLLCDFLKSNTSITRMIMWGNKIGDKGAEHIADMLRVNETIRMICLNGCEIGLQGFQHLSDALAVNNTLRAIDLGLDEDINDEHFRKLLPGLKANRCLETLEMTGTTMTEDSVKCMEALLHDNFYLKRLAFPQHHFDIDMYIPHGPGTAWNRVQYWLTLNRCNRKIVKDEDAKLSDWVDCLIKSSKYKRVDFSYFFLRNKPELMSLHLGADDR